MTNKEAIKILQRKIEYYRDADVCIAIQLAIDALEKQIPKKPIENEQDWAVCQNCGGSISKDNIFGYIINREITFCEHCGQAVDWESEVKNEIQCKCK